jgi:hypothetical protein
LGISWSGLESEAAPGKGRRKKEFKEYKEPAFGRWGESLKPRRSFLLAIHSDFSPRRGLNS